MSSLHTLITFSSDENLHICLFKLWFVNLKILWAAFCYFVLLDLVTTTSHHFNDESNYYCFFLAAFVSMVSDANLIWQLVMSKHEMGCQFFGSAFVSMIPNCAHIFSLTRCFCLFLSVHRSQVLLNAAHTGSVLHFIVVFTWRQALQPSFEMRQALYQGTSAFLSP